MIERNQQDKFAVSNHTKQGEDECGSFKNKRNANRLQLKVHILRLPGRGILSLSTGVWSGISLEVPRIQSIMANPVYLPGT